jgi:hypothetical protein
MQIPQFGAIRIRRGKKLDIEWASNQDLFPEKDRHYNIYRTQKWRGTLRHAESVLVSGPDYAEVFKRFYNYELPADLINLSHAIFDTLPRDQEWALIERMKAEYPALEALMNRPDFRQNFFKYVDECLAKGTDISGNPIEEFGKKPVSLRLKIDQFLERVFRKFAD